MEKLKKIMGSSINRRVVVSMVICITIVTIALGIASTTASYISTLSTLEQSVFETSKLAGGYVTESLARYKTAVAELASDALFASEVTDTAAIEARFASFIEDYEVESISYTDEMGITPDGKNVSFEDFFSESKVYLTSYVSDLHLSASGATFYVSAPIVSGGTFKGIVFAEVNGQKLSDIIHTLKIGKEGSAFILNQAGDTIACYDFNDVLAQLNVQDAALEDSSLEKLAEIQGKMTALTSGVDTYKEDGESKLLAYYPIQETENWSIGVTVNKSEFLSGLVVSVFITLGFAIAVFILAVFLSKKIANSISGPILTCAERMKLLSQGDVTTEVVTFDLNDETGVLATETAKTVYDLSAFINDVSECLSEIASGNLAISFEKEYNGDFAPIGDAIRRIITQMNSMIGNIQEFAQIVSNGSDQVSNGAQALSQGATEQASAVEELAATIEDISHKVKANAEYARKANIEVENVNSLVDTSSEQMKNLVGAMKDINDNSQEIKHILETIEDIAFQTNILALNAAIEAAKAGVAGRGFSVVAEEVRTLSEKCSEAAQNTADLIQTTIASVDKGSSIVAETAKSLNDVVSATKTATEDIEKISDASSEQSASIAEVTCGVDQIASVVQNNSATAEQSAAASTELSDHAKKLASLVESFNIKDDYDSDMNPIDYAAISSVPVYEAVDNDSDDKYFGESETAPKAKPAKPAHNVPEAAVAKKSAVIKPAPTNADNSISSQAAQIYTAPDSQADESQIRTVEKKPNAFVKVLKTVGSAIAKGAKAFGKGVVKVSKIVGKGVCSKTFWQKVAFPFVWVGKKVKSLVSSLIAKISGTAKAKRAKKKENDSDNNNNIEG